jgi:hypothetical protein
LAKAKLKHKQQEFPKWLQSCFEKMKMKTTVKLDDKTSTMILPIVANYAAPRHKYRLKIVVQHLGSD